ncbi:MAG: polysaccharide deacetylase family protein [Verrucomicrobiales bacterium]|nr:polysaccharide deacetylase family protein [Verrucomicrobiales bacterium]
MDHHIDFIELPETAGPTPWLSSSRRHHGWAIGGALLVAAIATGTALIAPASGPTKATIQASAPRIELGQLTPPDKWTAKGVSMGRTKQDHTQDFLLTFDDGPHPVNTPAILDWLREHKLHATFFVLGENVVRYPALVKRIVAEGHQIGNHSWSHPSLSRMSDDRVRSEIKRTHEAIFAACGRAPVLFRPPYGALKSAQRTWIENEFGYSTMLWDIDTEDWKLASTSAIANRIETGLRPGKTRIILAHDIHPRILPALNSLRRFQAPASLSL